MPQPPDDELTWVTISDFTPGIVTNSNYQAVGAGGNTGPVPGNRPGQAQGGGNTHGCIALPTGGLAPLPGLVTPAWSATEAIPPHHAPQTGTGSKNLINGFFITGPLYYYGSTPFPLTQGDEILVGQVGTNSSGQQVFWIDSLQINGTTATWTNIVTYSATTERLPFATMTGAVTRANASADLIGLACWVLGFYFTGAASASEPNPGTGQMIAYPDPTDSSTFGVYEVAGYIGDVFAHQNRMGILVWYPSNYTAPLTYLGGNENFHYTDPPNGLAITTDPEVFVQEDPSGYGAWGSISASELFLVKNLSGGVVISGDLNSPTVTALPGVTPTYGLTSRTAETPVGLVYASNNHGLWTWNGSNTSQKISGQLEDDFFVVPNMPPILRGPTVDIRRWGDWILVSNDWLYDTIGGGWWQLPPGPQSRAHLWYGVSSDGDTCYAAIPVPTSTHFMDVYARTTPANQYEWKSYPIPETVNKNVLVREVVVRAQGAGSIEVNLEGINGTSTTGKISPNGWTIDSEAQPQMYTFAVGLDAQDVTITLSSDGSGSGPAPIIYSVSVGFVEQNPTNAT